MLITLAGLGVTVALMAIAWVISVRREDAGLADVFWGPAIAGAGLAWYVALPQHSARGGLAVALAVAWAIRLSAHVLLRNHGRPEDRRYREIRARNSPGFRWKSLYLVFALQALLAFVVALPLLGAVRSTTMPGALDVAGALLWLFGFVIESIADFQLGRFQEQSDADRGVMDRGLWRYSRHPNYFGEICLWWGLGLIALAGGAWWALAGPVLITVLLLRVSGIALTEKDIAARRPSYRDYLRRTSALIPWPPRARSR